MSLNSLEIESRGAEAGINPMFGEWRQTFAFAPVPYRDGGVKLREFKETVRAALQNQFVFSDEIQLNITLFLDLQSVLETSETADVDNYAKSLLDALKGPEGIIIDDTQVQSLTVSWIDSHETYFEVEARASPDDFLQKPLKLYEMSQGLYYPVSSYTWKSGTREAVSEQGIWGGLLIADVVSSFEKSTRHAFRKLGRDRLGAYRESKYFAGQLRGFHKSRASDSGFDCVELKSWREDFEAWAALHPEQAEGLKKLANDVRDTRSDLLAALSKLGRA